MHDCCLNSNVCLSLNANWFPCAQETIRKAIEDLTSEGQDGKPPKLGIDFGFEDDNETISYYRPVEWDEWVTLPVRPFDLWVSTPTISIRAPTVIVSRNFRRVPPRTPHLNSTAVFERDHYTCAYCGKTFSRKELNLDHVIPQDKRYGGKTTWDNIVCSCIKCNTKKANRLPHEAGMVLLWKPKAPKSRPVSFDFKHAKHKTWEPFIQT